MATMGPVQSQVYVDPALTSFSIAYQDNRYIADVIFPEVQVKTRTGVYFEHDKSKFRSVNDLRAPGTRANSVNAGLTQKTYGPLQDHSLEYPLPWEVIEQAIDPLSPKMTATETITQMSIINKELDAFKKLTDTGVITQTATPVTKWENTSSDPAADVATAVGVVKKQTHKSASDLTVIIGWEVYEKLRNHPQMLDRIKYSERGIVTTELLAQVFGVKRVLIAEGEYNGTELGQADSSSYIWGKNVWVLYIADSVAIDSLTFGITLRMGSRTIDGWSDQPTRVDVVRIRDYYQQLIVAAAAGYYMSAVVS
jgi:hypothetical protein